MELTAKRLLWGKAANCGQVCVAPDYVLVPRDTQDKLVTALHKEYKEFFPDGSPAKSDSYSRMINEAHASRVKKYLDETKGTVVFGGDVNVQEKYVGVTVLKDVSLDDATMQE